MCGIFAIFDNEMQAPEKTLQALKTLEYRGYDSWGVVAVSKTSGQVDKLMRVEKHVGKIGSAILNSQFSIFNCPIAIGHTRWATHGGVTTANAHPHLDCTGRFAIVHNGIVENFAELKAELVQAGHVFRSETDSEVIAHLIEEQGKGAKDSPSETSRQVRQVFTRLKGLNAIVVLDRDTETITACKNGSPLAVGKSGVLASDAIALLPYTDQVHYMDDGEMVVLDQSGLNIFDTGTGTEKPWTWRPIERGNSTTALGQYTHFMLKEIHEQTALLQRISNIQHPTLNKNGKLFFVGCGSAYFAGLYGEYLCTHQGIDARAVVGSEFAHLIPTLSESDTVIFLSQSGETIDLVEHAKVLKQKHIHLVGIINREGSSLSRLCDEVIPLRAGVEQSVCATKSWFAKISVLSQLFGSTDFTDILPTIERELDPLYTEKNILPIVNQIKDKKDLFLIGRDRNVILALEGAMKLKEITYIHAEAHAGGELKHGSIALIEPGTPVIVIAPQDATYESIISNAMEVRARGAYVIGVSHIPHDCFDAWIPVENTSDLWALSAVIPIQLLAYHTAVALDRDPDKPRNLAKSVTVK